MEKLSFVQFNATIPVKYDTDIFIAGRGPAGDVHELQGVLAKMGAYLPNFR